MFHKFPYTDFHELNLDWLLSEWKKFLNEYEDVKAQIKTLDDAFKALQDFVNNYFDNLDVQEEINNKLDDMKDNGELQTILQAVIDTAQTVTLSPALSVSMYRGIVDLGNDDRPSYLQSACANNGLVYMFFANPITPGAAICKVYNTSGAAVRTATIPGLYHANGADYYNGFIYVATLDTKEIVQIDPDTLTETARYVFDIGFRSVTFDGGNCYAASGATLYKVNLTDETYTVQCSLAYTNTAYQSGVMRDGWLYEAGVNPSCIYRLNGTSGALSKIYDVDRYVDIYPVGELETVFNDRVTGKFYAASCSYYNFGNYRQGQIFEVSFDTNLAPKRIYSGGSVLSAGALYVGAATSGLPDGTQNNPFPDLASALASYNSPVCEQYKTFQITLEKDCADEILYLRKGNLRFDGGGYTISQIYAFRSSIEITNVRCIFENAGYANLPYPAYFNSCVVDIDGLAITDPASPAYAYSVVFNECVGTMFNSDLDGTNYDINMYRSEVLCNPALRARVIYEATNAPNMFLTIADAAAMTSAQEANSLLCANVQIRCNKSGRYADASFTPGATMSCPVIIDTGAAIECHVIRQTYTAGTGYTYEVLNSQDLFGNSVAACSLSSQVRFLRRY